MSFNYKALLAVVAFVCGTAAYQGPATWYYPDDGSETACGTYSQNTDLVVALNTAQYDGGSVCYEHIGVWYGSNFVDVTIVDECPGCGAQGMDLSPSAFEELAALSVGEISVGWYFE